MQLYILHLDTPFVLKHPLSTCFDTVFQQIPLCSPRYERRRGNSAAYARHERQIHCLPKSLAVEMSVLKLLALGHLSDTVSNFELSCERSKEVNLAVDTPLT